jgi:hypothetical protein
VEVERTCEKVSRPRRAPHTVGACSVAEGEEEVREACDAATTTSK